MTVSSTAIDLRTCLTLLLRPKRRIERVIYRADVHQHSRHRDQIFLQLDNQRLHYPRPKWEQKPILEHSRETIPHRAAQQRYSRLDSNQRLCVTMHPPCAGRPQVELGADLFDRCYVYSVFATRPLQRV